MTNKKIIIDSERDELNQLRDDLYDGDWQAMVDDLVERQGHRPYIYRLQNRIKQDLETIELIRSE